MIQDNSNQQYIKIEALQREISHKDHTITCLQKDLAYAEKEREHRLQLEQKEHKLRENEFFMMIEDLSVTIIKHEEVVQKYRDHIQQLNDKILSKEQELNEVKIKLLEDRQEKE